MDNPPSEASHDLAHALVNAMLFVRHAPMPQGQVIAARDAKPVLELAGALDRWLQTALRLNALRP